MHKEKPVQNRLLLAALAAALFVSGCVAVPVGGYRDRGYYGDADHSDCRGREDCGRREGNRGQR
jgi:hypothetical protein